MTASRQQISHAFSERLVALLKKQGHESSTAASGVKIKKLAERLGCSLQIARRYTLGEALPEPDQLLKLATWLKVSPGWLLFGDAAKEKNEINKNKEKIENIEVVRYVLVKVAPLFSRANDYSELIEFTLDLIYDVSHLKINKKTIFKMIDVAIQSAERFHNKKRKMA